MAAHVVTGPLAILTDATGKQRYYYAGTVLPEDLPAEEVKRLVATGLVAPVDGRADKSGEAPAKSS